MQPKHLLKTAGAAHGLNGFLPHEDTCRWKQRKVWAREEQLPHCFKTKPCMSGYVQVAMRVPFALHLLQHRERSGQQGRRARGQASCEASLAAPEPTLSKGVELVVLGLSHFHFLVLLTVDLHAMCLATPFQFLKVREELFQSPLINSTEPRDISALPLFRGVPALSMRSANQGPWWIKQVHEEVCDKLCTCNRAVTATLAHKADLQLRHVVVNSLVGKRVMPNSKKWLAWCQLGQHQGRVYLAMKGNTCTTLTRGSQKAPAGSSQA